MVGRAKRALSCFVMTLSYSRALYLEFFFDQTMENFLRGHVHAFEFWSRPAARDSLRQPEERRAGAARQSDPVSSTTDRVERALSLRATALPGARGQSERPRGTRHPLCARFVLGGPHLHHAGRMQSPGLALARSSRASPGPGPAATIARSPMSSPKNRPRLLPHAAASVPHRPHRDRAFGQDHLCPLRSQRLLHPAGSRRTAVDAGGLRYTRAHSRRRHPRSRATRAPTIATNCVLDPAHQDAVLKSKRKAFHSTPGGRLEQLVPESKTLLDLAFAQGESAAHEASHLTKLLEQYGATALRRAIAEALERITPRASSVAFPAAPPTALHARWRSISAAIRKRNRSMSARMIWRLTMNSPTNKNDDE